MGQEINVNIGELLQEIGRLSIENRVLRARLEQSRDSLMEHLGRNNNEPALRAASDNILDPDAEDPQD